MANKLYMRTEDYQTIKVLREAIATCLPWAKYAAAQMKHLGNDCPFCVAIRRGTYAIDLADKVVERADADAGIESEGSVNAECQP